MFDKEALDALFTELRNEYELEPEWEDIERAAHLAVAYSDAGVELNSKTTNLDPRIVRLVLKHQPD